MYSHPFQCVPFFFQCLPPNAIFQKTVCHGFCLSGHFFAVTYDFQQLYGIAGYRPALMQKIIKPYIPLYNTSMSWVAAKQTAFCCTTHFNIMEEDAILSNVLVPLRTSSTKHRIGSSGLMASIILFKDLISTI